MIALTRRMSVVRSPGTTEKPMIRIANNFLVDADFSIGNTVEVSYDQSIIIIKKINKHVYNNIQKTCSVSVPNDAEESL